MSYEDLIYPLQDKIFNIIDKLNTPFYLTGGTALSRFYFNHRYSDYLDFFVNDSPEFIDLYKKIFTNLIIERVKYEIVRIDENSAIIIVENILKVEFVNDVPFYFGDVMIKKDAIFSRIDNLFNILSNKICAFYDRNEPKDIVDIWIISKNIKINWKEIFKAANSKAAGIFPPNIAEKLENFDLDLLDKIKWIMKVEKEDFKIDINKIVDSILKLK
ncbi:MAG: nucleotidyl transferase AbiEii/AbiGii toxin family protein [Candidatus Goldbacteria bacterium]|nr:nucleotidyl transferase AbiEii/AbiGii toxin family protein [Candidatus Goldiibacteriota bacterium]